MTLWDKLYVVAVVKGLIFTFKNIFRKKCTRSYPEEKLPYFAEMKGMPVLVAHKNGTPKCVACGLCEFVCPPKAITITGHEIDDDIERAPKEFNIDMLRCIMCGMCEEACPKEAIVLSGRIELAVPSRDQADYGLAELLVTEESLDKRLKFIRKAFERWDT